MTDEQLHDLIEQYLLGKLPPAESARLESEIEADPVLFERVEIHRLGLMGLQRLSAADLREKFTKWDAEMDAPPDPSGKPNVWAWATGTLLLLLTAGAFWHFQQAKETRETAERGKREVARRDSLIAAMGLEIQLKRDTLSDFRAKSGFEKDSLARLESKRRAVEIERGEKALRDLKSQGSKKAPQIAMQFAPDIEKTGGLRDAGFDEDPMLAAANRAYDSKDFAEAARLLKSIPAGDVRQPQVEAMLPYALFYAKDFRAAIPVFLDLWEHDKTVDREKVQWYLLLCHVGEGDAAAWRQGLLTILQNPKKHKYFEDANKLKVVLQSSD